MGYGMVMPIAQDWTAERARALPGDGNRYEVLDGVLAVTPAPSGVHQLVVGAIYRLLYDYTARHGFGVTVFSPADLEFSAARLLQPDCFVAATTNGRRPTSWEQMRRLLLAVEVVSPASARRDRITKRRIYMQEGVGEYWIVDVNSRVIDRWRPDDERPEVLDSVLRWEPVPGIPTLDLDIGALFAEALGEG